MKFAKILICTMILSLFLMIPAQAKEEVVFAVPPWPGVTVKTDIAVKIVRLMGYTSDTRDVSASIAYSAMKSNDIDVFMGGWMPNHAPFVEPLLKEKQIVVATTNLPDCDMSLVVPKYVWDAGVHSIADLNKYADKFESTIYCMESGSGSTIAIEKAIKDNVADLGKWEQVSTTTPVMLSQAQSLIKENKWVTFVAWSPHWMNTAMDIKYLEGVPGTESFSTHITIDTIMTPKLEKENPNVARFLSQYEIKAAIQSAWIYDYAYKGLDLEEVSTKWIKANLPMIKTWLAGVKTADGKDAYTVVADEYK